LLMSGLARAGFVPAGRRREARIMIAAEIGVGLMGFAVKPLVDRPRPPSSLVWVNDNISADHYSFTAGHVHTFMVVYGWIIFLVIARRARAPLYARLLVPLCAAVLILVRLCRAYPGTPWPSDVVGSFLPGGSLL